MSKVAIFRQDNGRNVWVEGHVTIECVEHYVKDGFVSCNRELNGRAWGITEPKSQCPKCFTSTYEQLRLF